MIELAFVTCLLANPARCENHSLLFMDSHGLQGCLLEGQHELVRWIEDHPGQMVARWKCRLTEPREIDI